MHIAREDRRKVLIRARLRAGGPQIEVCVRDVSSRGLLVQASAPPPRGTYVELVCNGSEIVGRVVWRKDRRFGVQSRERINVAALIAGLPAPAAAAARSAAAPRAAAARAETVRRFAGAMEYAVIAVFVIALVATLGIAAFETLSRPFADVSAKLGD